MERVKWLMYIPPTAGLDVGSYRLNACCQEVFFKTFGDEIGGFRRSTPRSSDDAKPWNGIVWSNKGDQTAYNRYVTTEQGQFLQLFLLKREVKFCGFLFKIRYSQVL